MFQSRSFSQVVLVFSIVLMHSCNNAQPEATQKQNSASIEKKITINDIPVLDYEGLEPYLNFSNDTTYVINFWATWCKPCVEELPYFLALDKKMEGQKFKTILVSLDFPKQIEKKLVPYLNEHKIQPDVIVLDDPDSNSWIDKINPEWSGAIPATIVYRNDRNEFYEQSFESMEELEEIVDPFFK